MPPARRAPRRPRRRATASLPGTLGRRALAIALLALALVAGTGAVPASARTVITPQNFRGWGFDQCETPSQNAMHRWMVFSPFQAVGVYISGDARSCLTQANLTPDWVSAAAADGWRLLPITVGPQASCTTVSRYIDNGLLIDADPTDRYSAARLQGFREANRSARAAGNLGIAEKSTLWYDLEHFDINQTDCRESALAFVHAWTRRLHNLGYVAGFYSGASSGITMVDQARQDPANTWTLPDRIWFARWDGKANLRSSYLSDDGWVPGNRIKQYRGDHTETWGGVSINIDSNWMALGNATAPRPERRHCGGVDINFDQYRPLAPGTRRSQQVLALKCVLRAQGYRTGHNTGEFDAALTSAVRAFKADHGRAVTSRWWPADWVMALSHGRTVVLKKGSTDPSVRRLQRSLNAAGRYGLSISGLFDTATKRAVRDYQRAVGQRGTGHVLGPVWDAFRAGSWKS